MKICAGDIQLLSDNRLGRIIIDKQLTKSSRLMYNNDVTKKNTQDVHGNYLKTFLNFSDFD
jgi:hypothetical protein